MSAGRRGNGGRTREVITSIENLLDRVAAYRHDNGYPHQRSLLQAYENRIGFGGRHA